MLETASPLLALPDKAGRPQPFPDINEMGLSPKPKHHPPLGRKRHPHRIRALPCAQQIRQKIKCAEIPIAAASTVQRGDALMSKRRRTEPAPQQSQPVETSGQDGLLTMADVAAARQRAELLRVKPRRGKALCLQRGVDEHGIKQWKCVQVPIEVALSLKTEGSA